MLPHHIAIIMDGNGRWAKKRGLPRTLGHREGAKMAQKIVETCVELGIPHLTLYAFSAENWQRPAREISELMRLLRHYLAREVKTLHENNVRLHIIGDRLRLDPLIQKKIEEAEALTRNNTALTLHLALSYGARQEIIQAINRLLKEHSGADGANQNQIDETVFESFLYSHGVPDPDLLIRTGGEQRISNFLLWQLAYTELWFTNTLWPDFSAHEFKEALQSFAKRERRYGTAPGE